MLLFCVIGTLSCLACIVAFNVLVLPDLPKDWFHEGALKTIVDKQVAKALFYSFVELIVTVSLTGYYFYVKDGQTFNSKLRRVFVAPIVFVW